MRSSTDAGFLLIFFILVHNVYRIHNGHSSAAAAAVRGGRQVHTNREEITFQIM